MINALHITSTLTGAGINQEQAEATAKAIIYAVEQQYGDVASKEFVRGELRATEKRLDTKIDAVGAKIDTVDTKTDAVNAKIDLKTELILAKIDVAKESHNSKISSNETRIVRWGVVTMLGTAGILFALLRLFP